MRAIGDGRGCRGEGDIVLGGEVAFGAGVRCPADGCPAFVLDAAVVTGSIVMVSSKDCVAVALGAVVFAPPASVVVGGWLISLRRRK